MGVTSAHIHGSDSDDTDSTGLRADGTNKIDFAESLSVASSSSSDIITYTVPPGVISYLLRVDVSGTNIAMYEVLLNAAVIARTRTYFGGEFVKTMNFGNSTYDGYKISGSDVVIIRVTNFRPTTGNFEARLQYIEV